jgi:hypothetical protein
MALSCERYYVKQSKAREAKQREAHNCEPWPLLAAEQSKIQLKSIIIPELCAA